MDVGVKIFLSHTLCCTLVVCFKALQKLCNFNVNYCIQLSGLILVIKSVPIWFTN